MEMELEMEMEMEKRATETQPRAGGGRREARGSNLERLKRLKKEGDEMRRRRPMGVEGGTRLGGGGRGLQREQTNGPLLQQKRKRRESEGRTASRR